MMTDVTGVLRDLGIAVDSATLDRDEVELVILTGIAEETAVQLALSRLRSLDGVREVCSIIRVED